MVALSFCLHLAVFSTILFVPQPGIRYPSLEGRVYHVDLVSFPSKGKGDVKGAGTTSTAKAGETPRISHTETRRVALQKAPPISAQRVAPKPRTTPVDRVDPPSELIDKAISKIERKVQEQKPIQPERIQDRLAKDRGELPRQEGGAMQGLVPDTGVIIKLYQMEIENAIKGNWSYPVAFADVRRGKFPEAVVILTVRRDGKILKASFKRRSNNPLFDDSVLKAIERSDPLPGFPDGYRKSHEEVEINFSLRDLA